MNPTIIELEGELSEEAIIKIFQPYHNINTDVIIDCSKLEYFGFKGPGFIIYLHEEIQKHGKKIVLVLVEGEIKEMFELLGITNLIDSVESIEEAIEYFNKN